MHSKKPNGKKPDRDEKRSDEDKIDDDVAELIQEERGRQKPAALAAQRELARLKRLFRKHLNSGTEADFRAAMASMKPPVTGEKLRVALKIWNENRYRQF